MNIPDVEYVQWRMSGSHPKTDICDLFARVDRYGLGPGVYPKAQAPKPPIHPSCLCNLSPRLDLTGRKAREKPGAERAAWLREQGLQEAAGVMGSKAKAQAVLKGAEPLEAWNAGVTPEYRVRRVGEATVGRMLAMRSEELAIEAGDLRPVKLTPVQNEARDYVLSRGMETGHEYGAAIADGKIVARFTSHHPTTLAVPLFSGDGVELHHNHSIGDSLSAKDFVMLLSRRDLSAVYAHGHFGAVYSAAKIANVDNAKDRVSLAATNAAMLVAEAVDDGLVSLEKAQAGLRLVVMGLLLEDQGLIRYSFNSQSVVEIAKAIARKK